MGRSFNAARITPGSAVKTQVYLPTAGQTFKKNALVVLDAAGTLVECGADPTKVLGVSGTPAFQGPGQNVSDSTQTTGFSTKNKGVSVMMATRDTIFSCRGINGGTDPVTPLLAHVGVAYGVAKVGNDWVLDLADTTNTVCIVTDIDVDTKVYFVKFREAVLNLP
jgi:hypothetical protein